MAGPTVAPCVCQHVRDQTAIWHDSYKVAWLRRASGEDQDERATRALGQLVGGGTDDLSGFDVRASLKSGAELDLGKPLVEARGEGGGGGRNSCKHAGDLHVGKKVVACR